MRRCPECGEPVVKGQTHCFACGSDFVLSPARTRFLQENIIFIALIVAGVAIAVLLAIFIAQPKTRHSSKKPFDDSTKTNRLTSPSTTPRVRSESAKIAKTTSPSQWSCFRDHPYSQELVNLEAKITALERISQTKTFTKDEKDALRFAQNLLAEMKSLLQKIKDTKDEKEARRLIRQFRIKQNDINQFLFLLKNHLE